MSIVCCPRGHYYDDEKYASCPHCASDESNGQYDERTSAFIESGSEDLTVGYSDAVVTDGEDRTVGFVESRLDMDPVVGWLVCMDGAERGRDYRLHSGRNFVGRSAEMDVSVYDDEEISRENHCSVIYDPLNEEYLLSPGAGTVTWLNQESVKETVSLCDGDEIGFGSSKFAFIAFCKGDRKWL